MNRFERAAEAQFRRTARRLSMLAVALVMMALAAGCSGNAKDKLASVASSLSNQPTLSGTPTTRPSITRPPTTEAPTTEAPTTEAPTTEAPTTQAPTTQAPTTQAPTTQAPTTQAPTTQAPTTQAPTTEAPTTEAPTSPSGSNTSPGAATASSGVSPWVWVVLALIVLVGAIALAARGRGRTQAAARASSVKALDAYSSGVALHDRLQAELLSPPTDGPLVSAAGASEAQRMMDGLAAAVTSLSLEAPQDPIKAAAGRVSLSLTGLRSALHLAATSGPASEARAAVATTLRERLEEFASSLGALRAAAQGQPSPPTAV